MRKCRKSEENIKKSKLLDACLGEGGDLFKENNDMRKTKQVVATTMDGEKKDIAGNFGAIYSALYNSAEDDDGMQRIKLKIGLIQVKEEGWTGFSEGWQGCSSGFPNLQFNSLHPIVIFCRIV